MKWYYVAEGERKGPVGESELGRLFAEGDIAGETLVWNETFADWVPYAEAAPAPGGEGRLEQQEPLPGHGGLDDGVCCSCNQYFPVDDLIEYQGDFVCAGCKESFFQRISEGVAAPFLGGGTGQTPNAELMQAARESLESKWGKAVGFSFLYNLILQGINNVPYIGSIIQMVISPALAVGNTKFYVSLVRRRDPRLEMMFDGFKQFGTALGAGFLMGIFILLYMLLLIIPGIMKAYSYTMTYYILADHPGMGAQEAMARSERMMYGSRMKLFCLYWRFFGWSLLAILTLFIGFLWLVPYMEASMAAFYEDVRGKVDGD